MAIYLYRLDKLKLIYLRFVSASLIIFFLFAIPLAFINCELKSYEYLLFEEKKTHNNTHWLCDVVGCGGFLSRA